MKGKINDFNVFKNVRYVGNLGDNVIKAINFVSVFASSTKMELYMPTSYTKITELLKQSFCSNETERSNATQQFRNHMSALNSYLAFHGKTLESNVGTELGSGFNEKLRDYLDQIDVADRTRKDRAIQLRQIYRLADAAATTSSIPSNRQPDFSAEIRRLIAQTGLPPKTVAKKSNVDPGTLQGWLKGATPRADTMPSLHRLEAYFGLERDALAKLIERPVVTNQSATLTPSHRRRLAERTKHNFFLREAELGENFKAEWSSLFEYKTTAFPALERQSRGRWRLIAANVSKALSEFATRGRMVCPSADNVIGRLRCFFGVLSRLPADQGGIAWTEAPPITLAWLAHPSALNCFLSWMTEKSDGVRHGGHKVFAMTVCSLLRPTTGFLWQQPEIYRQRLPREYQPASDEAWQQMCAKSYKFLRDYTRDSNGMSRKPEEPISHLLAQPDPLKPIREAIMKIESDAATAKPGGIVEARLKRNALLLALLLSNPLRARSLMSMTWVPNGHGTLQGNPSEGYRIELQPNQLKTGDSRKSRAYSVKVADWVKPLLDDYLCEYRDTLLAGRTSDYLLIGERSARIWAGLNKTVFNLTRRYIPGSPGFSPHALRHLVATTWLRNHPGDFLTVAELLNDNLSTVLANYAHLRRDDSFARYEAYLDTLS